MRFGFGFAFSFGFAWDPLDESFGFALDLILDLRYVFPRCVAISYI